MATGAAGGDGMFRNMFEGCISGADTGIERRPYHRNCKCEMHKSRGKCSHANRPGTNVSYAMRRSWSEGSLALYSANSSSSPASSPAVTVAGMGGRRCSLVRLPRVEDYDDVDEE